jgi:RNA polymerase sigma-70 factor (ECF subfamily)
VHASGEVIHIDPALVDRARAGDADARRALVERAYPLVRRWARSWTGDLTDADDLTQDVIVRALRSLGSFRGESRFTSWLYSITRNLARERSRRRAAEERRRERWAEREGEERTVVDDDPLEALGGGRRGAALEALFRELPERQREALDLVDLQGLSAVDAARRLGVEPSTVRAHLHRARHALRSRILASHPDLVPDPT